MNNHETSIFRRGPFIANGRVVARKEFKHGVKTYAPDEPVSAEVVAELGPRLLRKLWEQKTVDTLPQVVVPSPARTGKGKGLA